MYMLYMEKSSRSNYIECHAREKPRFTMHYSYNPDPHTSTSTNDTVNYLTHESIAKDISKQTKISSLGCSHQSR